MTVSESAVEHDSTHASGDDCNIFRELEWSTPILSSRMLHETPNAS
jgi:hypothetical protein